jgi:hypothetical protein
MGYLEPAVDALPSVDVSHYSLIEDEDNYSDQQLKSVLGDIELDSVLITRKEQRKDPYIYKLMACILNSRLAARSRGVATVETPEEKRLLLDSYRYELVFGILYFIDSNDNNRLKIVVPMHKRAEMLYEAHSSPSSGHCKNPKFLQKLRTRCHWYQMRQDVDDFITTCPVCLQATKNEPKFRAPLRSLKLSNTPGDAISVDIVGPFPPTYSGRYTHVFVMMDMYSKWVVLCPLNKNFSSEDLARKIVDQWICQHSQPRYILSDNDPRFSKVVREVCGLLGIEQLKTLVSHPRTNGAVERCIQSFLTILRKACQYRPNNWNRSLDLIAFSFNTAPHGSTGITPFELNRGKLATLPSNSWFLNPFEMTLRDDANYLDELRFNLAELHSYRDEKHEDAQNKQARGFNKSALGNPYEIGQYVMVRDYLSTPLRDKLSGKWSGPYTIIALKESKATVVVTEQEEECKKDSKYHRVINIDRLSLYPKNGPILYFQPSLNYRPRYLPPSIRTWRNKSPSFHIADWIQDVDSVLTGKAKQSWAEEIQDVASMKEGAPLSEEVPTNLITESPQRCTSPRRVLTPEPRPTLRQANSSPKEPLM